MSEQAKGPIGRPKKNKGVSKDKYRGVVSAPRNNPRNTLVEFIYTEPLFLKTYLLTLKSNDVEEFYVHCMPDKILFYGNMTFKKTQPNSVNSNNGMYIHIDCRNVFSYYCKQEMHFKLNKKDGINYLLDEIAEFTKYLTMSISSIDTDKATFTVYNAKLQKKNSFSINKVNIAGKADSHFVALPDNNEIYCKMKNLDISEYKKDNRTKFKKDVTECLISFNKDEIEIKYKNGKENMISIIDIAKIKKKKQKIKIHNESANKKNIKQINPQEITILTDRMIEMANPISHLRNFLMHVKGEFDISYGDEKIIFLHNGHGMLLRSEIKTVKQTAN